MTPLSNLNLRAGSERAWRIDDDNLSGFEAAGHLHGIGRFNTHHHVATLDFVVRNDIGLRLRRIRSVAQKGCRRHGQAARHVAHFHLSASEQTGHELRTSGNADDGLERAAARLDLRRDSADFALGDEAWECINRHGTVSPIFNFPKSLEPTDERNSNTESSTMV